MKQYRFSPIMSEPELIRALEYLHIWGHKLCRKVTGKDLPVRGTIGIFCHDYEEYEFLTKLCAQLTSPVPNYKGKYFPLKQPISFSEKDGIPAATYEYLYIRQVDPYRSQVGDVDFVMPPAEFENYTPTLATGEFRNGARLFDRPEENMVEIWLPDYDVACYVATKRMKDMLHG